jgi:hypothetical protein
MATSTQNIKNKTSFTEFIRNFNRKFPSFINHHSQNNKKQSSNQNNHKKQHHNQQTSASANASSSKPQIRKTSMKQQNKQQNKQQTSANTKSSSTRGPQTRKQQTSASAQASFTGGPQTTQTSIKQQQKASTQQNTASTQQNTPSTQQRTKQQSSKQQQKLPTPQNPPSTKQIAKQQLSKQQKKPPTHQQKSRQQQQKKIFRLDYPVNNEVLKKMREIDDRGIDDRDMARLKVLFNEVRINDYNPVVFVDFKFQTKSLRDEATKYLLDNGPKKLCEKIYEDNMKLFEYHTCTLILCIGNQSYCFEIYEDEIVEKEYSMKLFLELIIYNFGLRDQGLDSLVEKQQKRRKESYF